MKEFKASVSPGPLSHIIDRLEDEGACDLAITHVDAFGALAEAEDVRLQRVHRHRGQYSDLAKVEIVCADADVERLVAVLREASVNGAHGDARIFVLHVESAVNLGHDSENRGERAFPA